jgi:hypothetical protein
MFWRRLQLIVLKLRIGGRQKLAIFERGWPAFFPPHLGHGDPLLAGTYRQKDILVK